MIKVSRKVLCLDWDKRSLRIVVARISGGRMVLEDAHSHRLPQELDANEPEALGEFIHSMLRRHRLRFKSVVVDVSRERAVINRLTLPPTPTEEVAAAVRFQAMRELPFPLDSAAVDYVTTGQDENGMTIEVLLAAVTTDTLERVRATCEAAGLTPERIGLRPYANLVSARHVGGLDEGRVLFVDVGPGATEIDVFDGDALDFARSATVTVPVPAGDSSSRGDSRLISLAEIADLDSSAGAVEAAVNELLVEVTRTLQAYRATEPEATITSAVVAGGTGIETQFADELHQRLGYAVELYDPTIALEVEAVEASKLRSFSAALGLAWGLSREGLLALDFLNPKRPVSSRETFQRRARAAVLAASVVLVAAASGFGYWYWTLKTQRDDLRDANAVVRADIKKKTEILNQVERTREWELEAVWPEELLTLSQAAIEPGKQMLVQGIEFESGARNHRITLRNVYASDVQVLKDYLAALNALEVNGDLPYKAVDRTWNEIGGGTKFKWKTDIDIKLVKLLEEQEEIKRREKERKSPKSSRSRKK
ncbi:MAG: pilus assembly protein PilM [Phycisphaerae bacterium]|nr:pilus assembly protein PilM [Phycisphaerae bacterium]